MQGAVDEWRNPEPMEPIPFGGSTARRAVRVAEALYRRWLTLAPDERERLEPLAESVKRCALDLRGRADSGVAERELADVSMELALAIANSERGNPLVVTSEFEALRRELSAQLGRLAQEQSRAA